MALLSYETEASSKETHELNNTITTSKIGLHIVILKPIMQKPFLCFQYCSFTKQNPLFFDSIPSFPLPLYSILVLSKIERVKETKGMNISVNTITKNQDLQGKNSCFSLSFQDSLFSFL